MRVIIAPSPTEVIYCGLAVDAGTRDEMPSESGMAHFTEHMSFKGTARRKSWHITNRMEAVGGDLNAFTGKEETVYYCTCLRPHLARAVDVLVDIVMNSTYPQHEMEREVEVVASEIESYNDSPGELIYDEFENLLFAGHPLGRNILGDADQLRQKTTADMLAFVRRTYTPDRMVFFLYGKVEPAHVIRLLEKAMAAVQCTDALPKLARNPLPPYAAQHVTREMDTHQAHVMMGCRAYGGTHDRQPALFMLSHLLGGPGMNSRLNLALREKRGLVYTVESTLTTYTDTGVWAVYFGCEPQKAERCKKIVLKEISRLAEAPLTPATLAALKKQLKGMIGISCDNFENVAIGMGKRYLHYAQAVSSEELAARIERVTADDLWQTAKDIFRPENISVLTYT